MSDDCEVRRLAGGLLADYDESTIRTRLARVDRTSRSAFSAACAERLLPLFERCVQVTGEGDPAVLRLILDKVWLVARGEDVTDLVQAQQAAEAMVPIDAGVWYLEMGYGQSAAAAVAYAVRAWLTDDPQESVWGARQVYEVADYAAQHALPDLDLNSAGAEEKLLQSEIVQTALSGIAEDLRSVEAPAPEGWSELRHRARREGRIWAQALP